MQNKYDDQILDNLAELSDTEIEELLGAGWGSILSFTHLFNTNTLTQLFTCCFLTSIFGWGQSLPPAHFHIFLNKPPPEAQKDFQ